MYKLTRFKIADFCTLSDSQIKHIEEHINYNLQTLNNNLAEGYDRYDKFNDYFRSELNGMMLICNAVGIKVQTKFVEGDDTECS
ncbi:hypothetical protein V7200_03665 [Cytobacillus firmus]|uniref:Uncharacterized protein n=1 Tax=Cytobacillus firmus TaxID=1399 RepID=A0A800MUE7_CYTFI|nr:hypothetical protein [Cytobacillus firmus]KAF0822661.1 hypothetical protein KIS1582_3555 [Cytobacillus firmus]